LFPPYNLTVFVSAVLAAGGRGNRVGADRPKQLLDIGGRSMLELSVSALAGSGHVHEIVVAVPAEHVPEMTAVLGAQVTAPVTVVAGGRRRQDSVANAFGRTSPNADLILVHDAARPFVTTAVIARTLAAAAEHGAAIAAMAARDTIKRAKPETHGSARAIDATLPREEIFLAQTPQVFRRDVFARVLAMAGDADATDEAMLAERAGVPVWLVEGDAANVKITTAGDLEAARNRMSASAGGRYGETSPKLGGRLLPSEGGQDAAGQGAGVLRIGTGYDLHRLVARRPLILGGVKIPFDFGLDGHSDADIVCHAVTDAVLGAAAAGDIGRLFPDTDPKWRNADSIAMLRGAVASVHAMSYRVSNVDVTVIAERPKLLPYLDAMRANLAAALEIDVDCVSIKGKTNEGQDAAGRGEAMACHAVALLSRA
jgi:2-C-methyl-D-erythritol 4-phosphate cytidylyltransferase / 2-C-methyl-D-erythritol 2,4-cyclodiphosphate synthase